MDNRNELQASPGEQRYLISGEAGAVYNRFELRDRIRRLEIFPDTDIATEESGHYRPAAEFDELSTYFSLVSQKVTSPSPMVGRSRAVAEPVVKRILPAIVMPFKGMGSIVIIIAAALQVIPVVNIVAGLVVGVFGLAIARAASRGQREMPNLAEMGGPAEIVLSSLKLLVIGFLGSFLPTLVIFFVPMPLGAKPLVLLAILILYLPASMAILARTGSLGDALSPSQVFGFIGVLGTDYFAALASILVVFGMISFAALLPATLFTLTMAIVSVWAGFYMMHLLGWAMYRRADQL